MTSNFEPAIIEDESRVFAKDLGLQYLKEGPLAWSEFLAFEALKCGGVSRKDRTISVPTTAEDGTPSFTKISWESYALQETTTFFRRMEMPEDFLREVVANMPIDFERLMGEFGNV
jgi:hypothetical protein